MGNYVCTEIAVVVVTQLESSVVSWGKCTVVEHVHDDDDDGLRFLVGSAPFPIPHMDGNGTVQEDSFRGNSSEL